MTWQPPLTPNINLIIFWSQSILLIMRKNQLSPNFLHFTPFYSADQNGKNSTQPVFEGITPKCIQKRQILHIISDEVLEAALTKLFKVPKESVCPRGPKSSQIPVLTSWADFAHHHVSRLVKDVFIDKCFNWEE